MKTSSNCCDQEGGKEVIGREDEGERMGRGRGWSEGDDAVRPSMLKFENQSSDRGSVPASWGAGETLSVEFIREVCEQRSSSGQRRRVEKQAWTNPGRTRPPLSLPYLSMGDDTGGTNLWLSVVPN